MNLSKESKMAILMELLGGASKPIETTTTSNSPFEVGKLYHCRTVTMAIAGKLKAVYPTELVFEGASWVADTGRFNEYLRDCSRCKENEPFKHDVIVGRQAIIDCTEMDCVATGVK